MPEAVNNASADKRREQADAVETTASEEAVTDARDAVNQALSETGAPHTFEEKREAYTNEEMKKIYSDPITIGIMIGQGRARVNEFLTTVRQRYDTLPNDKDRKAINLYEKELREYDALEDFKTLWQDGMGKGDKCDFSEFMEAERQAEEAYFEGSTQDQNRDQYFARFQSAYNAGFGPKTYGIKGLAYRRARGTAIERAKE